MSTHHYGVIQPKKVNLSQQGEVDMNEIRKSDIGKVPVRIDSTTIILKKNGK